VRVVPGKHIKDAIVLVERKSFEEHRVAQRKYCRVRADAERQGHHGDERENVVLGERACAVPDILKPSHGCLDGGGSESFLEPCRGFAK